METARKIRRQVMIGGVTRWISGRTEQEYAENLIAALACSTAPQFEVRKHNFRTYARQLNVHIFPALGDLNVEDFQPADIQVIFKAMDGPRARRCERIKRETGFEEPVSPRRFRTTVLTNLYDTAKDVKQSRAAAGHTAAMTLEYYVIVLSCAKASASP